MQIIVVGCGKVGRSIVAQLSKEDNNVTVIDTNAQIIRNISTNYDVMGIVGNGSSFTILDQADLAHTDMIIAVTERDEVNLLTCVIAKLNNNKIHTVARVRSPQYAGELAKLQKGLDLTMTINPEMEAAKEISRLLNFPSAIEIFSFARNRIDLLRFRVPPISVLVGRSLKDISDLTTNLLVCIIERNSNIMVPNGDTVIQQGDVLTIIAMPRDAQSFFKKIGVRTNKCRNVMIVGGGQLSFYLSKLLLNNHANVTIVERDMERCEELVNALPGVTVDCGDGTEKELLEEEHLENMDGFVACTGLDEVNTILSLYAMKHVGRKVVTKVNHVDFGDVIEGLQLDSIVNPKELTAQKIVHYVRAAGNSLESNVETLYKLMNGRVEALEFLLEKKSSIIGVKLADLNLKPNVLIAGIVRDGRLIIPGGQDAFQVGDTVIVVTTHLGFHEIFNILA
ncbi:Trk system potassium transporter TrkA [Acidaminococcus timonensis]|jgi:trk system potassium uptake protein|uniref:Trk system potassium transporter TrkA n=1 Tax=Acidaminococcus timonensis TaxID=1871002 RepID=UPI00248B8317|nr:Trk system potassium transporter TrkA [Acidaminococcus timonensis]